jgi:hypothetical protein
MPYDDASQKNIEREYEKAVAAWKEYIRDPKILESSNTSDYTKNEPYERIVALGKPALQFLMRDLERGEFLLNQAARQITGVDVVKVYPREKVTGEQDISKLWVRWWREKGQPKPK